MSLGGSTVFNLRGRLLRSDRVLLSGFSTLKETLVHAVTLGMRSGAEARLPTHVRHLDNLPDLAIWQIGTWTGRRGDRLEGRTIP